MTVSSGAAAGEANLDKFFSDVEVIKANSGRSSLPPASANQRNPQIPSLPAAVRDLRAHMDADVARALKAKQIKQGLEALGSRTGPSQVAEDHRDAVARQYYTVTGEKPDEATVDAMAVAGGEGILTAALAGGAGGDCGKMRREGAFEGLERAFWSSIRYSWTWPCSWRAGAIKSTTSKARLT
ncbi:hypothetical protein HPP92_018621 [Vanilla planifolia]|uniref:Syntaxin N-terminal domain-containing protein n=1 Tax=Vanilla planifolia TaxID=51239 RepID=A0A835QA81_VANPL|nr:hypothetical protein HPP92_018621 [Vanilla planifolia]